MISLKSVNKSFNGNSVLEDINLSLERAQVYCLLGRNGAGKTTILNLILDLLTPDSGLIEVLNKPGNKLDNQSKARIGVLREDLAVINELTGFDYLTLTGHFYNMSGIAADHKISELADYFFDEKEVELKKRIGTYSFGMKKKVAIIAALINEPDLLILDEPFAGLDPVSAKRLVTYLKNYISPERLILLSSHNLNYIKQISTHIGIVHKKRLFLDSKINDFPVREGESFEDAFCRLIETEIETEI
ncbi:MAG TPA: ABC transporter ATP-binding protein [Bacteroidales bacterium]|jgi:ABC-2 type transport system ATP-binding protein|nr:ABC transporter ATP-binding protein [Bacteroidales bacterium]HQH23842.1 ABC transporter ATP-binding protein [Bacteroidales bacterium]HQJ81667.1 ABC transporter ATP-binding protein [Bacteroidales bacterium]